MSRENYRGPVRLRKSAESVTESHPDKILDVIGGRTLDEAIYHSQLAGGLPRVALEGLAKGNRRGGLLVLAGEVTLPTGVKLPYKQLARDTIRDLGYTNPNYGFWHKLKDFRVEISEQSENIALGVRNSNHRKGTGAGDQGKMFGGAVAHEGREYMPMPISLARALTDRLTELFRSGKLGWLRPDGKSQVVINYYNGVPVSVERVTIAASHDPAAERRQIGRDLYREVVEPVLGLNGFKLEDPKSQFVFNGAGEFSIFGPLGDAGVSGRKIVSDSYGGYFHLGGGNMNGKDPTKVDASGAAGARYMAKTLVAAGLADVVEIEVAYTIGQPIPDLVQIYTYGTEHVPLNVIEKKAKKILTLSVDGIIDGLGLWRPVYEKAAKGGWFGRSGTEFPWERVGSI